MSLATLILGLIQVAPTALVEITNLYNAVKSGISSNDQATIDSVLAAAQISDKASTDAADATLASAAQRK